MAFARPSSDLSYLQARVSGYGTGRPRASSAALPGLAPPQRDLTEELRQAAAHPAAGHALRVFLRVRPEQDGDFPEHQEEEKKPVLEMQSNVHLLMHAPKDSATYKIAQNLGPNGKLTHRYTFTHIFRPEVGQQQLFRQTTLNHITEFVNGHSCLLFTYGATNSGKTYTVQGTSEEPGVLPRALDMVFNSVGGQLYDRLDIQPRHFSDVVRVSPREQEAALRTKRDALRLGADDPAEASHTSEDSLAASSLYRSQESLASSMESLTEVRLCPEIERRRRESAVVNMENQPNTRFSVWVSFFEIYNEFVFDLLEKISPNKKRRTALHLGLDKKGNTYVKGLRQIEVRSADEACQVLRAGRHNLHFASNRLNHNSSRSHCVFTVKLVRMLDTDDPSVARISMLSVCDLAGSERVEKTLAAGPRMKEAGNINASLMVLGRCMKAMRQNQAKLPAAAAAAGGAASLVPYRDSKLTRIFQSYFSGHGSRVTMIVNVSPSPVVFDETVQVLKFAALAKQVSVKQEEKRRAPSRFSLMVRRSVQMAVAAAGAAAAAAAGRPRPLLDATSLDETRHDEHHQNLLDLIDKLRHELVESRRENATIEARLRQELCSEFEQHMVQIEKNWQERLQETERFMESRAELQLSEVAKSLKDEYSRKRRRTGDSDVEEDEGASVDELAEAQERAAAAEQRCLLLERQLEAEAADRQQMVQRDAERQEELTRMALQLAEAREASGKLQHQLEEAEERCRRHLESKADDPLVAQLTEQVAKLKEDLRFRDMDLRETKEYLQEGGDEFLQLEAASERLQQQVSQLQLELAERDETLRDQMQHQADLEELLAGRSRRINQLEEEIQKKTERCTCRLRGLSNPATAAAIPEETGLEQEQELEEGPAELSFNSRMRSLRNKTGAMLRQVASPMASGGSTLQLQARVESLQSQVSDLTQAHAALQKRNTQLEQKLEEGEKMRVAYDKLSSQLNIQERLMVDLSKRYIEATTPARPAAEKRSAPPDLNDTTGFEEAERVLLEEQELQELRQSQEQAVTVKVEEEESSENMEPDEAVEPAAADGTETERLSGRVAELESTAARLTAELQAASEELAARSAELSQLQAERDALRAGQRDGELTETRDVQAARESELAELKTAMERAAAERDTLTAERDALTAERDADSERVTALTAERDALTAERDADSERVTALTAERDALREAASSAAARFADCQRELDALQKEYKQALHLKREAEADAAVMEREMKALRDQLRQAQQGDAPLADRLRARETEIEVLQARVAALTREEDAFSILKAELDAKKEELRQCNASDLRGQLQRAEADNSHIRDELEKRSNQLLKLNIQIDNLKRQITEKEEDVQKVREDRNRLMQMSEQNMRRKNDELNREKHESSHLREMMARLTPKSSSVLQSELERTRAECRRKDDRIEQLEARLRSVQSELNTPTPVPKRTAARPPSVDIIAEVTNTDNDEPEVTPMVLKTRARSSRKTGGRRATRPASAQSDDQEPEPDHTEEDEPVASRRRTRRNASRTASTAVRFNDENEENDAASEGGSSSVSRSSRSLRPPLDAITEQQLQANTPEDQPPPPRAAKSTATKRKLFQRCSDHMLECSPVEITEKAVSPRKVVTRNLRSRKK